MRGTIAGALIVASVMIPIANASPAVASTGVLGIDLGTLGGARSSANAINDAGVVVGAAQVVGNIYHAFVWTAGSGMVDIGTAWPSSSTSDINDANEIAGTATLANGETHPIYWDANGTATDLGTLGGTYAYSVDINNAGVVIGVSRTASGADHGFAWTAGGGMIDLGTLGGTNSYVADINDDSQVVGSADTANGERHAFRWDATNGMVALGNLGGQSSTASVINELGQVAGTSDIDPGPATVRHGYLWDPNTGFTDFGVTGTVTGLNDNAKVSSFDYVTGSMTWSAATGSIAQGSAFPYFNDENVGINNAGQVAGGTFRAFVTDGHEGTIVLDAPGFAYSRPADINESGQVVGYGFSDPEPWCCGDVHAMIWTRTATRSMSIAGASVVESDTGTRNVFATVTLSSPSTTLVSVKYDIVSTEYGQVGTFGTVGSDFKTKYSGTLKFSVGPSGVTATSTSILATILGDSASELDEHFSIVLTQPSAGVTLGTSIVPLTIVDNDPTAGVVAGIGDAGVWEGDSGTKNIVKVAVTLSQPATIATQVVVHVAAGTATAGADFVATTSVVKFPVGSTQKVVKVTVFPDTTTETAETIAISLSNPQAGVSIGKSAGTVTIQNDDA